CSYYCSFVIRGLLLLEGKPSWTEPVITPNLSYMVLLKGGSFTLQCRDNSSVKWSLERDVGYKKDLKSENKDGSYYLTISYAKPDVMGRYVCINEQTLAQSSVYIFVKDPPNLFQKTIMVDVISRVGDDPIIPCLVTDPDTKGLKLEKCSGEPVPKEMNTTASIEKGITINSVQKIFEGCYVCTAKYNGKDVKSDEYNLIVRLASSHAPDIKLDKNKKVILIKGETFEVKCSTVNVDHAFTLGWICPEAVDCTVKRETRKQIDNYSKDSQLLIHSVKVTDSGIYQCAAENKKGKTMTSVELQILERGFINISASENTTINVKAGESLTLTVEFEAYPRPENLYWMYEGEELQNASDHIIATEEDSYRYHSRLKLVRLRGSEGGNYTFFTSNSYAAVNQTFDVHVLSKPEIISQEGPINGQVRCVAAGYMAPEISWYSCKQPHVRCSDLPGATKETIEVSTITLPSSEFGKTEIASTLNISKLDFHTVECVAQIGNEQVYNLFSVNERIVQHELFTPLLTGFAAAAGGLCFILFILFYKYLQKPKYQIQWKVIEGINGNNYVYIDPSQLPYDQKWEFPRDKLRFGKTLGSGAFGKVVEATAYGMSKADTIMTVAVKMLKPRAHATEKEALMSELKVLSYLGHHMNIVNLLGACTVGGPTLVITEYCCFGDLLNFLRRKRDMFFCSRLGDDSHYKNIQNKRGTENEESKNGYMTMRPSTAVPSLHSAPSEKRRLKRKVWSYGDKDVSNDVLQEDTRSLDTEDLLSFSYQVAKGMNFLASKNCIHRDLAARNVLLTEGRVAKICDFGLARDIKNDSNYVVKGNARLPVKWMAPESIFECVYTFESDVWSYGILLWEIFSLGSSPYPGMPVDSKFYKMIKEGYRMIGPEFAPNEMYEIMKACWDTDPLQRPSFAKIVEMIELQLSDSTKHIYLNFSSKFSNIEELHSHFWRLNSVGSSTASTQPLLVGEDVVFEDEQRHQRV
uniref:Mast/stem cell growth factor receptor n=1 Tax=Lepisosteus oculatus TaxID=7918 RepID=W5NA01_LEPOC